MWPLESGVAGVRSLVPYTQLDFWIHHNERQFSPPYVTAIWAPHHLAGVLLALLLIHLLRARRQRTSRLLPIFALSGASHPLGVCRVGARCRRCGQHPG